MVSEKELDEKNFIQEKGPTFLWVFILLFLLFLSLMWGIGIWQNNLEKQRLRHSPFYQVTNRQFSIFLWQNPKYMRTHTDFSESYLPHFHTVDDIHVIPEFADEYAAVPADILYRYHTWKRLVGDYVADRPIMSEMFHQFLNANTEWFPAHWKAAPQGYVKLVAGLQNLAGIDLQTLSYAVFPLDVRMAFMGWLNFTREWDDIHEFVPTEEQLQNFLNAFPHYARSYWRNLIPDYLEDQNYPWFLKSAIFNSLQQQSHPDK